MGTPGRDVIVARGGNDRIEGGAGNDVICAGGGVDNSLGGDGNDVLLGQADDDVSYGGPGSDDLAGGPGDDDLFGDAGDDALFGGPGADQLSGGEDRELLVGGPDDDVLDAATGEATLSFAFSPAAVTVDLPSLAATGEGNDRLGGEVAHVVGSAYDDDITGSSAANRLDGRDGDDVLRGGDLADRLTGGAGTDSLDGGPGSDEAGFIEATMSVDVDLATGVATGDGSDTIVFIESVVGSNLADILRGDAQPNGISGAGGNDVLDGRAGNDMLSGGFGDDALSGAEGDDGLYGGVGGRDTSDGGPGNDTCWADDSPTACEMSLINGPNAHTWINEPASGARIPAASFNHIAGRSSAGHWGPEIEFVELALRLDTPSGCRWWSHRRGKLVARPCLAEDGHWFKATFDTTGGWSYRFYSELPPGRYELRSSAVNTTRGSAGSEGPYREDYVERGRNEIAFTLT